MIRHLNPRRRIIFLLLHTAMVITRWSSLGFLDRRRRIFFLLLHTQDGGSYIMPEKHDRPAESHAVVFRQKKKNFLSSSAYTGWGEKKYSTSHTLWYLDRRRRIFFFFFIHRMGGEKIFYFSPLENFCPPRHEPLHQQKKKKFSTSL